MSQTSTIEQRLAHVESDVAQLKSQLTGLGTKANWLDQITGSFKDDPDFDEVLRLAHEIRQSDRPDAS